MAKRISTHSWWEDQLCTECGSQTECSYVGVVLVDEACAGDVTYDDTGSSGETALFPASGNVVGGGIFFGDDTF